ncbi:hypothetical protein Airi02_001480 [Actinoallomurus iriomotensis]|uniref:Transposase IS200-like domain-containing protein n=1 Tax=Actinoallomurus iriomotensis TaxID=478107 RepID=A0A9W6RUR1_9ACTN|nr:hypothetical protein Airi02_001480 [Actinoallomurus iriomotensis]
MPTSGEFNGTRPCPPARALPTQNRPVLPGQQSPRQEHNTHVSEYLRDGHLQSPSYLAASCGGTPLTTITEYIQNQKRPD